MLIIYKIIRYFYSNIIKPIPVLNKSIHILGDYLISEISKINHFNTVKNDSLGFRFELVTGIFERKISKIIKKQVKPGMIVLDIGAHVGYYTKMFSKLVGPQGKVIAFEPHPKTFLILRSNTSKSANVILVPLGIGDKEFSAELKDFLQSAYSSLFYDANFIEKMKTSSREGCHFPRIQENNVTSTYKIDITSVDIYLNRLGIDKVDFIKMDIEGSEMAAIRGMNCTLKSSPRIKMIMEFNPRTLRLSGTAPIEVWDYLSNIGFSIGVIKSDDILILKQRESFMSLLEELERNTDDVNLLINK